MAFNKVSMVALVLLVVVATAHARPDVLEDSSAGVDQTGSFCTSCSCRGALCTRYERKVGGCPFACGEPCACTRSIPPICHCNYRVETCNPSTCAKAEMTLPDLATFAP